MNDQWQKLGGFEVLEVDVFTVVASPYRPINNPYVIFTVTTVARVDKVVVAVAVAAAVAVAVEVAVAVTATTR